MGVLPKRPERGSGEPQRHSIFASRRIFLHVLPPTPCCGSQTRAPFDSGYTPLTTTPTKMPARICICAWGVLRKL